MQEPGSRAGGLAASPVTRPRRLAAPAAGAEPAPVAEAARTAVTLGHAWTEQQDEELRDGVELGCTLEELAEQLDLDAELVSARLAGLGLVAAEA